MKSPLETFIPLYDDKFRIAVRMWFPPDGKPSLGNCIAYPGWMDNAGSFDTLAPLLCAQLGLTIAAIDPPGCGWSDHYPQTSSYADYEEPPLVFQLANRMGWERFGLLAHSRGGAICTVAAGLYPERVEFLIVLDSSMSFSGMLGADVVQEEPQFTVHRMRRGLDNQKQRKEKIFPSFDELVLTVSQNENFKKSLETSKNICLRHIRPVSGGWTFIHDRRLYGPTQFLHLKEEQLREFLREITCPVLLVFCQDHFNGDGGPIPRQIVDVIADRLTLIKQVDKVIVPGGHHVHSDDAPATARAIEQWWNKTSAKL